MDMYENVVHNADIYKNDKNTFWDFLRKYLVWEAQTLTRKRNHGNKPILTEKMPEFFWS